MKKVLALLFIATLCFSGTVHSVVSAATSASSFKNTYPKLNTADKSKLISFLYYFTAEYDPIVVKKMSDFEIMEYIRNGFLSDDVIFTSEDLTPVSRAIPKEFMVEIEAIGDEDVSYTYNVYSAKQVNKLTQKLFGRTIAAKDYIKTGEYKQELVRYKDGYFFMRDYGKNAVDGPISSQVNKLYALGNGLYYVNFTNYQFPYTENVKSAGKYLLPMELWTSAVKKAVLESAEIYGPPTVGYAFLKEVSVSGKKSWRLLEYNRKGGSLTEKQIKAYKNK
ncbi:hypothetical protein J2T13_004009 [Paenibacillus sp. DS2015]|uniref:hypothetical protein n=1 Tax=Paenibacillus sp. DS2015 TaxID=3373917 RepID=UPI003D197C70